MDFEEFPHILLDHEECLLIFSISFEDIASNTLATIFHHMFFFEEKPFWINT
jgi:hypothetical protein